MPIEQPESPTQHLLLHSETVEKYLRDARAIHLVIIVICGFLFLIIFNMVFGWQILRPAASRKFFANNLAHLALAKEVNYEDTLKLSLYAQGVVQIAVDHCSDLLDGVSLDSLTCIPNTLAGRFHSRQDSLKYKCEILADSLDSRLSKDSVWRQEECIRLFVEDVNNLKTSLQKRFEKDLTAPSFLQTLTHHLDSLLSDTSQLKKEEFIHLSYTEVKTLKNGIKKLSEIGHIIPPALDSLSTHLDSLLPVKWVWCQKGYAPLSFEQARDLDTYLERVSQTDLTGSPKRRSDLAISKEYAHNLSLPTFISFDLQEIEDRFKVNEETRGRRVSPRERAFPIVGTLVQIEDMGVPIAVFLFVLTYWWYCYVRRAFEATRSYLKAQKTILDEHRKDVLDYLKVYKIIQDKIRELPHKYLFIEIIDDDDSDKGSNVPTLYLRWGLIGLFLVPYLVVMSNLLAMLHETGLLDVRYHATEFHLGSSTIDVLTFFYLLLLFLAGLLAYLGWRMSSHFIDIYHDICKAMDPNKDLQRMCEQDKVRAAHLFSWTLVAPFSVFGTFSAFYFAGGLLQDDYFLTGLNLCAYILVFSIFCVCTIFLFSKWRLKQSLRMLIFWFMPVTLIVSLAYLLVIKNQSLLEWFSLHPFPFPTFPALPGVATVFCLFGVAVFVRHMGYINRIYKKWSASLKKRVFEYHR